MTEYVFSEVERVTRKYGTRDPYKLLNGIRAVTVFSDEYGSNGLKGYSTIMNRIMYAVINKKLSVAERKIAAGHEAGHLVLHRKEILASPVKMMKDFNIFDNADRYEQEANSFLADFLVSDEDVLSVIRNGGMDFFRAASELYLPPPLYSFKLHSMMRRGYKVNNPMGLNNRFLTRTMDRW